MDLRVRIEFDSRWRIGTGTTRSGVVDVETWADADRHLCIPASHLKRRLRERAEFLGPLVRLDVCRGRLAGNDGPEAGEAPPVSSCVQAGRPACVTCRIFGSPRVEPRWRFTRGVLDRPLVKGPREHAALLEGERLRMTHNRVDPWGRRVAEDLLFTVEAGRQGLAFTATCAFLDEGDPPTDEVALLVGAVGALESLGARWRRGYGQCRAWVLGAPGGRTHDDWVDVLVDEAGGRR